MYPTNTFIRVDRGKVPPHRLDDFTSFMRDEVVPALRSLPGYGSTSMAIDRATGAVSVTTDWRTAADRERSDAVLAMVLKNAGRLELVPVKIDLYEMVAVEG